MQQQLVRLASFLVALPLFFGCSASRDFTAFSSNSGGYHGQISKSKPAEKTTDISVVNAQTFTEAEAQKALEQEISLEANTEISPDLALANAAQKVAAAQAEASVQAQAHQTPKKLGLAEKLLVKKAQKMLAKAQAKNSLKAATGPNAIKAPLLDQNLKLALIFLVVSLIGYIFSWILGTILFIVALVFLILWISTL